MMVPTFCHRQLLMKPLPPHWMPDIIYFPSKMIKILGLCHSAEVCRERGSLGMWMEFPNGLFTGISASLLAWHPNCATVSPYASISHPEEWLQMSYRARTFITHSGTNKQLPHTLYKMYMTNVSELPTYSALFVGELLSVSLSFVFCSALAGICCYSLFHDIPLPPRSPSSSPVNHHFPDDVSSLPVCQASTCSWCQFLWPVPHHSHIGLFFSLPAMHF